MTIDSVLGSNSSTIIFTHGRDKREERHRKLTQINWSENNDDDDNTRASMPLPIKTNKQKQ